MNEYIRGHMGYKPGKRSYKAPRPASLSAGLIITAGVLGLLIGFHNMFF